MKLGTTPFLVGPFNGWTVETALQRIAAAITASWGVQHDADGAHGDVTCTSLDVSGVFATSGEQVIDGMTGTGNHNVLLDADAAVLVINAAALVGAVTITGFSGGTVGRRLIVINGTISTDDLTLSLDDLSSRPDNRIQGNASIGGDSIVITPGRAVELVWCSYSNARGWHACVKA